MMRLDCVAKSVTYGLFIAGHTSHLSTGVPSSLILYIKWRPHRVVHTNHYQPKTVMGRWVGKYCVSISCNTKEQVNLSQNPAVSCSRGVAGLRCVSSLSTLFIRDCIHNTTQPREPFYMIFIDDKCTVSVGLSLAGYKATYSTWKSSVFNMTDNKLWLYHSSLLFYYGNAVTLPSLPDAVNWIINCVSSYWKKTFSLSLRRTDTEWTVISLCL